MKRSLIVALCLSMLLISCTKDDTNNTKDIINNNIEVTEENTSIDNSNTEEVKDENNNQKVEVSDNNSEDNNTKDTSTADNKTQEYKVFYYNGTLDKLYYTTPTITGDIKADPYILGNMLKQKISVDILTPGDNLEINSITENSDSITIDLSSKIYNMLSKMGGSSESGLLDSIAFTYGYNYGVDKVAITVDGEPYMGGHVILELGDYITVDLSRTEHLED